MLIPLAGHHNQGRQMRAQADAKTPLRKRLWADLVRAKIRAQAEVLALTDQPTERLLRLASEVRSGDTTNREAAAAQAYWPALFGPEFRRDRASGNTNAMLNYGYAVLRAAAARAIVAAGLHPSLSLHHVSDGDALSLADDVMEPFRPAIDLAVFDLVRSGANMDTFGTKADLVAVLQTDYETSKGRTPLAQALVRLCQSLACCFNGEARKLDLPDSPVPLAKEFDL